MRGSASTISKRLLAYWLTVSLSALAFWLTQGPSSQVLLALIGAGLIRVRRRLTPLLPRSRLLRYVLGSLLYTSLVAENLAVNLQGDLHPNLLLNALLWFGPCTGFLLAWWALSRSWTWRPAEVWLLCGTTGALIEQNALVLRLLFSAQVLDALIALPLIHAVYGAMFAPVQILAEAERRELGRPPWWAYPLAASAPIVLFFLAGLGSILL